MERAVNPLLAGAPSLADAWSHNVNALSDWLQREQQVSRDRGLWTGGNVLEGGHPTQAGVIDAAGQYGNALMMGSTAPKPASLIPAWRVAGRVFSSPEAANHQSAWNLMPKELQSAAVNNAASIDKVFVNERGQVMSRRDAFNYALDNDMLHPSFVRAFKTAAGDVNPNAELTAEMIMPRPVRP